MNEYTCLEALLRGLNNTRETLNNARKVLSTVPGIVRTQTNDSHVTALF